MASKKREESRREHNLWMSTIASVLPALPVYCQHCQCTASIASVLPALPVYCQHCYWMSTIASVLLLLLVYCHHCQCNATIASVLPPLPVYCHHCQCNATIASVMPPLPVYCQHCCSVGRGSFERSGKNNWAARIGASFESWSVKKKKRNLKIMMIIIIKNAWAVR